MAFTNDITTGARRSIRDHLAARVDSARAGYARYRMYRRTLAELARLSDRDLADLGLNRNVIEGVAREAAYGA